MLPPHPTACSQQAQSHHRERVRDALDTKACRAFRRPSKERRHVLRVVAVELRVGAAVHPQLHHRIGDAVLRLAGRLGDRAHGKAADGGWQCHGGAEWAAHAPNTPGSPAAPDWRWEGVNGALEARRDAREDDADL